MMLFLALQLSGAGAAEIKVLSTGNIVSILTEITGEFERKSGHKLVIEYWTVGQATRPIALLSRGTLL
jgi:hypothetical protein